MIVAMAEMTAVKVLLSVVQDSDESYESGWMQSLGPCGKPLYVCHDDSARNFQVGRLPEPMQVHLN